MFAIPAIGDFLINQKMYGTVNHVGVLVGPDIVLQNTPSNGEHVCTLYEFSAGQPVSVHPTGADHISVLERTRKILAAPQKYNAFKRNCEHTAYEVAWGAAKSPQVEQTVKNAIRIVLAVAFTCVTKRKAFRVFR